jgi:hypothetical protein
MRKASTALLEQGIQTPSPAPALIPAETSTENLYSDWYSKWGHFTTLTDLIERPNGSTLAIKGNRYNCRVGSPYEIVSVRVNYDGH